MTKKEAAIVSAYTGFIIGSFTEFHEYVEQIMERPVSVYEMLYIVDEIREKSESDFLSINIVE